MDWPVILLVLVISFYLMFVRPGEQAKAAYRENVIGFIAAISIQPGNGGIYLGDVYRMVDLEIKRRKAKKLELPDYPVFALEILFSYAKANDMPALMEYCHAHLRDAGRISIAYDMLHF